MATETGGIPPDVLVDLLIAEVGGREGEAYHNALARLWSEVAEVRDEIRSVKEHVQVAEHFSVHLRKVQELALLAAALMAHHASSPEEFTAADAVWKVKVLAHKRVSSLPTGASSDRPASQPVAPKGRAYRVLALCISSLAAGAFLWTGFIAELIEVLPNRFFWWAVGFPAAGVAFANAVALLRGEQVLSER